MNGVVVERNTYVDARSVTIFKNVRVNKAVVAVHADGFGRPGARYVRVGPEVARRLRPVRGDLGVRPTPASLVPTARRAAVRPPPAVRARRVVALRARQDPRPHLRASGLHPARAEAPPSRIAHPAHAEHAAPRPQAAHPAAGVQRPPAAPEHAPRAPAVAPRPLPPRVARPAVPPLHPHVAAPPRPAPVPIARHYAPAPGYPLPPALWMSAPHPAAPVHRGRPVR